MLSVRYFVFALVLGTTVACSSDSDKKDGSAAVSEDAVTVSVSAEKGGEVKLGDAALKIPAGALAEDLEVTLEAKKPAKTLPDQDSLSGLAYDFGPDGTTFEKPVELTLPLAAKPGDGEVAVISWYDAENDAWQDLTASVDGDVISAEVEHFTVFMVRFKGVASGAFDCGFTPCGAEGLAGSWKMAGACIDTGKQDNPFAEVPGCEDVVFDVGVDAEGEVTFTDDTFDYHWTFTGNVNLDLSQACLDVISQGKPCAEYQLDEGVVCAAEGARCKCSGPAGDPDESMGTGTYVVSGDEITLTNDDGTEEPDVQKICVKGNEAKLKQESTELDEESGEMVIETSTFVLTRQ